MNTNRALPSPKNVLHRGSSKHPPPLNHVTERDVKLSHPVAQNPHGMVGIRMNRSHGRRRALQESPNRRLWSLQKGTSSNAYDVSGVALKHPPRILLAQLC